MKKRYAQPTTEVVTIQIIQMLANTTAQINFGSDVNADQAQSRRDYNNENCSIWDDDDNGQSEWLQ